MSLVRTPASTSELGGQASYVTANDSINIPVEDGEYFTGVLSAARETGTLIVAFYNANDEIVTPTSGTINHSMSPIEGQWQTSSSGGSPINAVNCGANALYEVPVYNGPAIRGRIILTGIVGADYCRAYFWRA